MIARPLAVDYEAARRSRERQAALDGILLVDGDKNADVPVQSRRGPRRVNGNHKTVTEEILRARAEAKAAHAAALAPPALSIEDAA